MLTPEQIEQTKEQLIKQVESTFPEDKKASTIQQIQSMNDEQFEQFLIQNKLIKSDGAPTQPQKCIFCSIIDKEIPSYQLDENKEAVAILEINPISKGHALVVPKEHIESSEKIPKQAFSLAKKIATKIKVRLKPKDVNISSSNIMGHSIINILPIYENETPSSERKKADEKELFELQKLLEKKQKLPTIKKPKPKKLKTENVWLPRRMP